MAQYRGSIAFGFQENGWSEQYYLAGADSASASANMSAILAKRKLFLPSQMYYKHCVISEVTVRGDVYIIDSGGNGSYTAAAVAPINTAALYAFYGGSVLAARHYVRGIDAATLAADGTIGAGTFTALMDDWASVVLANCVGRHRLLNPTPPPAYNYAYVTLSAYSLVKTAFRKVGRPFGQPVGRRRIG